MAESLPPSYESVVGNGSLSGCRDYWPSCLNDAWKAKYGIFETFDVLIKKVNIWLECNPGQSVFSCETIEKKVYRTDDIYGPSLQYPAKGSSCMRIKGFRLWYTKNLASCPQILRYMDIVPNKIDSCEDLEDKYPQFESFQSVIDHFNIRIMQHPLPGRIVSIQTVPITVSHDWWGDRVDINPEFCAWPDMSRSHRLYFLRVYFEAGPVRQERIGIADFAPQQLECGLFGGKPKFTSFQEVVDRAAVWVKQSNGIRITNMQTLDTKYLKMSEIGCRLDTLSAMEYKIQNRPRITVLRISYVESNSIPRTPNIFFRSFYPHHNCSEEGNGYETLIEAQERVKNWLETTGAKLLCIETVYLPSELHMKHPEEDRTVFLGEWCLDASEPSEFRIKMLQHVR
ncbi:hypothetical protein CAPTEDRAFT_196267 [Capitella teleta]|uniref:Uncharacterized protein n=1 Tax=Capitella teleta TaxID=283909 RepID=R7TZ44_CAPTE|nr:hypothetical protein CAPTEDRAFT_196267 [Capitella teleta]|eukprot:ELT99203.1 hypothetical protein CAPTEDRAFT_196267 [Capitella teleta]